MGVNYDFVCFPTDGETLGTFDPAITVVNHLLWQE